MDLGPKCPKIPLNPSLLSPNGGVLCRSEGLPLTGLFHPWAQWDMGLDTLENSSAAVVVAAALGGGGSDFSKNNNALMFYLKSNCFGEQFEKGYRLITHTLKKH